MAEQGGLLSFLNSPSGQGLLSAVGAGLAGARRGAPLNGIGAGLLGGLQGYNQAQDNQWQNEQRDYQRSQMERQKQIDVLAPQFYRSATQNALQMGGGPTNAAAAAMPNAKPSFDLAGYSQAVMGVDPMRGIQLQASLAKDSPFDKVSPKDYTPESVAKFAQSRNFGDLVPRSKMELAPNGQVWNPYQAQPGQVFADPNKPFSVGTDGKPVANAGFQKFEITKSRASAPNVTVKNDIKTGESLAGQIGPMVKDSYIAAQGAAQNADAANRVIQAIDSGKVVAGPFANGRLTALQLGDMLGVAGKDAQERIYNTRQAIRGLAEMTLQGRKQMAGQGAITESESKLAERAMSGDVTMTAAEIKQLANASRRAAKWTYDQHQGQLNNMRRRQDLAGMADFYNTAPFPAEPTAGGDGIVDFGSLK